MPNGMPAEEQVKRMNLAVFSPKKDIDVLATFNVHGGIGGGTIASMVAKLADRVGAVALSHNLLRAVMKSPPPPPRTAAALAAPADDSGTAARPKVSCLVTLTPSPCPKPDT